MKKLSNMRRVAGVAFVVTLLTAAKSAYAIPPEKSYQVVDVNESGWVIEVGQGTGFESVANSEWSSVGRAYKKATGRTLTWDVIRDVENNYNHDKSGRRLEPKFIPFCRHKGDGYRWTPSRDTAVWDSCSVKDGDEPGIALVAGPSGRLLVPMKAVQTFEEIKTGLVESEKCDESVECLNGKIRALGGAPVPEERTRKAEEAAKAAEAKTAVVRKASDDLNVKNAALVADNTKLRRVVNYKLLMWGLCVMVGLIGVGAAAKEKRRTDKRMNILIRRPELRKEIGLLADDPERLDAFRVWMKVQTLPAGTSHAVQSATTRDKGSVSTETRKDMQQASREKRILDDKLAKAAAENARLSKKLADLEAGPISGSEVASVREPQTAEDKAFLDAYLATRPGTTERDDVIRRQCARERTLRLGATKDGDSDVPQCETQKRELQRVFARQKQDASQPDPKVVELQRELAARQEALGKMDTRLELAQKSIEALTADLERSNADAEELRNRVSAETTRRVTLDAEISRLREENLALKQSQEASGGSRRSRDVFHDYAEAKRVYEMALEPVPGVPDGTSTQASAGSVSVTYRREDLDQCTYELFERMRMAWNVSPQDVEEFFQRALDLCEKMRGQAQQRRTKPAGAGMLANTSDIAARQLQRRTLPGIAQLPRGDDSGDRSPDEALDDAMVPESLRPSPVPADLASSPMFPQSDPAAPQRDAADITREVPVEELDAQAAADAALHAAETAQEPSPANPAPVPGPPPGYTPTPPPPSDAGHARGRRRSHRE